MTRAIILIAFAASFISGLVLIPNLGFQAVSHQTAVTSPSPHPTAHPSPRATKKHTTTQKKKPGATPSR